MDNYDSATSAAFLAAHPTIEELGFRPRFCDGFPNEVPFTPGSLPSLKVLRGSPRVAQFFLLDESCHRPWEYLESIDLNDDRTLQAMEVMDRRRVKHLGISATKSMRNVLRLAELFPCLVSLSIEQTDNKDIVGSSLLYPSSLIESVWNSRVGFLFSLSSHS